MVNAPRMPIVKKLPSGSLDNENKLKLSIAIPMKNEPITLMIRILNGKFVTPETAAMLGQRHLFGDQLIKSKM